MEPRKSKALKPEGSIVLTRDVLARVRFKIAVRAARRDRPKYSATSPDMETAGRERMRHRNRDPGRNEAARRRIKMFASRVRTLERLRSR